MATFNLEDIQKILDIGKVIAEKNNDKTTLNIIDALQNMPEQILNEMNRVFAETQQNIYEKIDTEVEAIQTQTTLAIQETKDEFLKDISLASSDMKAKIEDLSNFKNDIAHDVTIIEQDIVTKIDNVRNDTVTDINKYLDKLETKFVDKINVLVKESIDTVSKELHLNVLAALQIKINAVEYNIEQKVAEQIASQFTLKNFIALFFPAKKNK